MVIITKLTLQNFLSYKELELNFKPGRHLILDSIDGNPTISNGSGKS